MGDNNGRNASASPELRRLKSDLFSLTNGQTSLSFKQILSRVIEAFYDLYNNESTKAFVIKVIQSTWDRSDVEQVRRRASEFKIASDPKVRNFLKTVEGIVQQQEQNENASKHKESRTKEKTRLNDEKPHSTEEIADDIPGWVVLGWFYIVLGIGIGTASVVTNAFIGTFPSLVFILLGAIVLFGGSRLANDKAHNGGHYVQREGLNTWARLHPRSAATLIVTVVVLATMALMFRNPDRYWYRTIPVYFSSNSVFSVTVRQPYFVTVDEPHVLVVAVGASEALSHDVDLVLTIEDESVDGWQMRSTGSGTNRREKRLSPREQLSIDFPFQVDAGIDQKQGVAWLWDKSQFPVRYRIRIETNPPVASDEFVQTSDVLAIKPIPAPANTISNILWSSLAVAISSLGISLRSILGSMLKGK